jgi:beta-phosphoglucomutase-like phosphatase (HAD superfamily)
MFSRGDMPLYVVASGSSVLTFKPQTEVLAQNTCQAVFSVSLLAMPATNRIIGQLLLQVERLKLERSRLQAGCSLVGPTVVPDHLLQAAIFDVDGTLVDTMPGFYPSWVEVGVKYGLPMTEERFYSFAGMPLPDIVMELWQDHKPGMPCSDAFIEEFLAEKRAIHLRLEAAAGPPSGIDTVIQIARAYKAQGVPVACATSGTKDIVDHHLACAGILDIFEHIVYAADLPKGRGKPKPDIYMEAARRLGVDPLYCRAYEDGESGLHSAYAAGMQVVDVRHLCGYPLPDGLRAAMSKTKRPWLLSSI